VVIFQLVPESGAAMRHEIEPRRRLYRWARARRQTWIAVSEHARSVVVQLFGTTDDAVGRIYNGVPVDPVGDALPSAVDADARGAFGLSADEFVVLSVGRLTAQKGHDQLIRAVAMIAAERPEIRVLIAGDGPERDKLAELVEVLGVQDQIRLLGHVDRPRRLHALADLFALPSRYEGTPFAMLEAMADGLPILAARFGGVDEVVEHGRDGLLVAVGDVPSMADAIETLTTDRARLASMAARARSTVEQFSEKTMVTETLAVLDHAGSSHVIDLARPPIWRRMSSQR
jgi:glycosyltransferase involved in cell wall biosynthesis